MIRARLGRWLDHALIWVSFGAVAATGIYEPWELGLMAGPLLCAAVVELLRRDLARHHRLLEVGALLFFLGDLALLRSLFTVAIHTLFILCGVRLTLPREPAQRRQLVLMGFLLFLTTALSTTDATFLLWSLLWLALTAMALLQQAWEASASVRRGAHPPPPYGRVPLWMAGALVLALGLFLGFPRVRAGFRIPLLGRSILQAQAGLGDQVNLGNEAPIEANPTVAARILLPPDTDPAQVQGLDLLPGLILEATDGLRWVPSTWTPPFQAGRGPGLVAQAEFLFSPSLHGILALPYGTRDLRPSDLPLRNPAPAGSVRWRYPGARTPPVTVTWTPTLRGAVEPSFSQARFAALTALEPEHEAARRASFTFAPGILPTPDLVAALEGALRRFKYTTENPSGRAGQPLEDFLERSQAGHCEYFASAMALMLRARGIPARVVNGYRLGPWVPEGHYFRISQDQAHSWVEYWDRGVWRVSDPTPLAAGGPGSRRDTLPSLDRWLDALRFSWERYVVRFSDEDQLAGLAGLQTLAQGWTWRWKAPPAQWGAPVALAALAWVAWRTRGWWQRPPSGPGRIRALAPLVRSTRRSAPPEAGDTARTWILRLADLRPERRGPLLALLEAAEAEAYAERPAGAGALGRAEARLWRGWRPTSR